MYNYEWDRLRTWLDQYGAVDEGVRNPEDIIRLDLSGNSLKSIPENISLLSNLLVLNVANNKLTSLPESMRYLHNLRNIDIRRNSFEELPEFISFLSLRSLNAAGNKIKDISIIKDCKSIRVLDLSSNLIKKVENIFDVDNELRTLNLSSNYIDDLTDSFHNLKKLLRIDLSKNLISEIPQSVGELGDLEEFEMTDNQLKNIDEAFFALDIEIIDFTANELSSLHLHSLESLEKMVLDENEFESLTLDSSFAPYLKEFSCDGCGLKEFLRPASKELAVLCYASNEIEVVPKGIDRYAKRKELDIDGNNISELPDSLANLSYLKRLYVNGNPLSERSKKVIAIRNPEICDINMKTGIIIEKASEQDLDQMAELLGVLFAIETDFEFNFEKQLCGIKQLFEYEGSDLLVAKDGDKVVGMITMQRLISSAEGGYIGQMEDLVVHEEYRKMGVGSRLINKMRNIAQEYGYGRIQLAADVDNKNALEFYNRRGFYKTHLNIYHYKV